MVGSVAIDTIETPWGKADRVLGGSATYAALAARLFTPVHLVAVVGKNFPSGYARLFEKDGIHSEGLTTLPGRTFYWKGRYNRELQAQTLALDLGVFASFKPKLTERQKRLPYAFLGNVHPALQGQVLGQMTAPRLTACDSRDHWIKEERRALLRLMKRVDMIFLNDQEARLLTGAYPLVEATRALARMGPKVAVVKKGEHGVLAASREAFFTLPSFPVCPVMDPTGAGDAFAGACLGYLAAVGKSHWSAFCQALQYGCVVASLTIEAFGPESLIRLKKSTLRDRMNAFQKLSGVGISS